MKMELEKYFSVKEKQVGDCKKKNKRERVSLKQCTREVLDREPHLRPQDPDDDGSQLLMLTPELPHLVQAGL